MLENLARKVKYGNMWGLRGIINQLYYDEEKAVIDKNVVDYVVVSGCKFPINDQLGSLLKVNGNEWFFNIQSDDVVLDIGANIGAIALPAAMIARKVYAVEPLFGDELRAGIKLNKFKNVQVLDYALGKDDTKLKLAFSSKEGYCDCISFQSLLGVTGKIDWLKIDCEGAEWDIEPEQTKDIPEIRIEYHIRRGKRDIDEKQISRWMQHFRRNKYIIKTEEGDYLKGTPFIYCFSINASQRAKK